MTDEQKLNEAIEKLKSQMAKTKDAEWRRAYLTGIAQKNQTLNITRGVQWQN